MTSPADLVAILLVLAASVATLNHLYVGLPRAIALLLGSLIISALIALIDPFVAPDLGYWVRGALDTAAFPRVLLDIMLGLLLFAASFHVDLRGLREHSRVVFGLATLGVIIATIIFGAGIWLLFALAGSPVSLGWCMVLGAVLAPTDAVAVDAVLRRAPLPRALKAAISGESLLNDGAGVVLFQITLGLAHGEHGLIGHGKVAAALAAQGLGGGAIGALSGLCVARLMRAVNESGLCLLLSFALVTGTYRLADLIGVSGPIAAVACGLALRLQAPRNPLDVSIMRETIAFWSVIDELLNAMLFVLIGFELFVLNPSRIVLLPLLGALPLALLSRFVSVSWPAFVLGRRERQATRSIAILTWAGLRGGVSVALGLTVPDSPYRGRLLVICYAVVVLSMVVQGLTLPWFIRRLYQGRQNQAAA